MTSDAIPPVSIVPKGYLLAPIHSTPDQAPLTVCVVVRPKPDPVQGAFILLREVAGSRIYLGAIADAQARIHDWLELWVQAPGLSDPAIAGPGMRVENRVFDQRWQRDFERSLAVAPDAVIQTGMEANHPPPILLQSKATGQKPPFIGSSHARWKLCQDDGLLESLGLPAYSKSSFRYLYDPQQSGEKMLLATQGDAPANASVQGLDQLTADAKGATVFNPHAGLVRVQRLTPLELEDFLGVLEGKPWEATDPGFLPVQGRSIYAQFQQWSKTPKGLPFLLHGMGHPTERLNEALLLKLSAWRDLFLEVRGYAKSQQLPLLNLTPASFAVRLQPVGETFPALWAARGTLSRPGQAYPLELSGTAQRFFIRLGNPEPSPFLPEGLAVHSQGMGSVRIRTVIPQTGGVVVEGTLIAEEYLGLNPNDLLCLALPVGNARLEFYAHVHTNEATGPKEARFRTVPTQLDGSATASLTSAAGTVFPKSHYEVWPLASSPCDLYSLGILGIRILLAHHKTNLPVLVDDVLSLARSLGNDPAVEETLSGRLGSMITQDKTIATLLSPHAILGEGMSPEQARPLVSRDLWLDTMALLLRLFPGTGPHSFCKDFGDVSPAALDTAFDAPLETLESLIHRLRSILMPTASSNEEIANVLLAELGAV